ncbi:permease prefix domain 1-containing protein [Microbacterium aurugineum]
MTALVDQYVATVVGQVPRRRRQDIEQELRGLIAEEVDALGADAEDAERAVLTRMGNPDLLAARYEDRQFSPVGPRYFSEYTRLMSTWLLIAVPITFVLVLFASMLVIADLAQNIKAAGVSSVTVGLVVAGAITVLYFVKDRRDAGKPDRVWSVDALGQGPEARQARAASTIITVTMLVGLIVLIFLQRVVSSVRDASGDPVPLIDPDLWLFWIPLVIALFIIQIACTLVLFFRPGWARVLAWLNLVVTGASVLIAGILLLSDQFFNPAFMEAIDVPWSGIVAATINGFILTVIVSVTLIDTVATFIRAYRR